MKLSSESIEKYNVMIQEPCPAPYMFGLVEKPKGNRHFIITNAVGDIFCVAEGVESKKRVVIGSILLHWGDREIGYNEGRQAVIDRLQAFKG